MPPTLIRKKESFDERSQTKTYKAARRAAGGSYLACVAVKSPSTENSTTVTVPTILVSDSSFRLVVHGQRTAIVFGLVTPGHSLAVDLSSYAHVAAFIRRAAAAHVGIFLS